MRRRWPAETPQQRVWERSRRDGDRPACQLMLTAGRRDKVTASTMTARNCHGYGYLVHIDATADAPAACPLWLADGGGLGQERRYDILTVDLLYQKENTMGFCNGFDKGLFSIQTSGNTGS